MAIHPTAIISSEAKLPPDVTVGPYAIIEGPVTVGPGTVVHAHGQLIGPLTMGAHNVIHANAIIGGTPQDRKYKAEFSETIIGDDNVFREGVTIHRGTGANTKTVIGHRCYFMATSHVGHNARVGNDVTLINGSMMAGHSSIGDRAILGGGCSLHQFCRVGRLALISNSVGFNVDFPPFFLSMATNAISQLNAVGLRRSGMSPHAINALRRMFQLAFRENRSHPLRTALAQLPPDILAVPEVQEVIEFCNQAKRGVARFLPWSRRRAMLHEQVPPIVNPTQP
jgi:UDP-N-acetylglucosamine acyltransferase